MNDNVVPFPKLHRSQGVTIEQLRGRVGRFAITDDSIKICPDMVLMVMGRVIVLQVGRCEHGSYIYLAMSPDFDVIEHGETPPGYDWIFHDGAPRAHRIRSGSGA